MSQWNTSFEQHQMLPRITESLRVLESAGTEGLSPSDLDGYARLLKVLKLLENRLINLDPELFHPGMWAGNYPAWTTNLQNYVTTYSQDKNPAHLQNANSTLDDILTALRPFPLAPYGDSTSALISSTTAFQAQLIKEIEATRAKSTDVRNQLDSLSSEIAQTKERLASNDQTIEQQKSRLDQSIAEFQKQYSQSESNRSAEFSSAMQKATTDLSEQAKRFDEAFKEKQENRHEYFSTQMTKVEGEVNKLLSYFNDRKQDVDKIFGAIGSASFAGHFATTANRDASAANWLRGGALALMCSMIGIAALSFYESLIHPELDWKIFLFRLATVFIIAIPAVYAAQESSKHRERERHNRKIHLELAAIDAYLVQLPEAKRNEVKERLTDRFFGTPDSQPDSKDETNHALLDILRDAVKNLTKGK